MSVRLLLSGIAAALLLAATVLTGLYLGLETQDRFQRIDSSWRDYVEEADHRGELLSRIRGHLGYGGIIHDFKNYVLRQSPRYLRDVQAGFADFKATIEEYRQSHPSPLELAQLEVVETTIEEYESKLRIAIRAAAEKWEPARTDRLVKVDDTKALQALARLDKFWRDKRRQSTEAIALSVSEGTALVSTGFQFLAGLFVVSLILYALFYVLQRELRQTVRLLKKELSDRKAAEHVALKFSRAAEQSPSTIIITDTERRIEYVNPKFCELSGYSPDEVKGKTPGFLQSGQTATEAYSEMLRQLKAGEEWRGSFKNKKKDGTYYWVRTAILPLRDESGTVTHYIGIGEDTTERRRVRDQIERAQKMEAVGLLASGVAHDFNNVLTTILGNVHLARLETPRDGEVHEELEQIEIAALRARNLVAQLLVFARRQPAQPIPLRVGEAIDEVCRLIRASIQKNIALECNVQSSTLSICADPTQLHQVLVNLCSNAAEAIGASNGAITLRAEAAKGDGPRTDLVRIVVADTGPGILPENQASVFEPFFTTKPAGKGTGLGLSVVASLVKEMNGQIKVESEPGKGARFEILVPRCDTAPTTTAKLESAVGGRERILLVDDEPEVVTTCRKLLEKYGYDVDAFVDPLEAVAEFEKSPESYDLVMTDFVMPNMNGEELAWSVRTIRPECPILICTAYQPATLDVRAFKAIKVIEKPVDPVALDGSIRSLLASNRPSPRPH